VNKLEKKTIEFLGLPDHEDIYFCKKYELR